jgi:anti-sigma B factor antagonist
MTSVPPYDSLVAERVGGVTVVRFTRKALVDELVIASIREELFRWVDKLNHRQLLLNFSGVKSFSSAMLATLVDLRSKLKSVKGKLALCGLAPETRQVFEITKLVKVFAIHDSEEEALDEF